MRREINGGFQQAAFTIPLSNIVVICLECGNNGVNTCEWAIQDRLVHCHHIGVPHDHPPHLKPQPNDKGGYYLR